MSQKGMLDSICSTGGTLVWKHTDLQNANGFEDKQNKKAEEIVKGLSK